MTLISHISFRFVTAMHRGAISEKYFLIPTQQKFAPHGI